MVRESTRVATRKLMRGEVGLDEAGDHVHAGALGGQHKVHAHGARHLRQSRHALFHVLAFEHHQVGQFVDQNQYVGQRERRFFPHLLFVREKAARPLLQLADFLVELVDVATR